MKSLIEGYLAVDRTEIRVREGGLDGAGSRKC